MKQDPKAEDFLSNYSEEVFEHALRLRKTIFANLPNVTEQVDLSAKMIAYCYGQKYTELICAIIPSKKGLKLGFNRGTELSDPDKLLKGEGKISRYVEIKTVAETKSSAIKKLIKEGLKFYKEAIEKNQTNVQAF